MKGKRGLLFALCGMALCCGTAHGNPDPCLGSPNPEYPYPDGFDPEQNPSGHICLADAYQDYLDCFNFWIQQTNYPCNYRQAQVNECWNDYLERRDFCISFYGTDDRGHTFAGMLDRGAADIYDNLHFLNAFLAGDLKADITGDGDLTIDDMEYFQHSIAG